MLPQNVSKSACLDISVYIFVAYGLGFEVGIEPPNVWVQMLRTRAEATFRATEKAPSVHGRERHWV
eukprot:1904531-Amphidinium_carterae.1